MIRVAFLRGINVGGKNKIAMAKLGSTFARIGLDGARTYINTGNVIFSDPRPAPTLVELIEKAIDTDFGFSVPVLVLDLHTILAIEEALPETWVNDASMKCDVMLLWDDVDRPQVLDDLAIDPDIDDVLYVPGAVIWRVDRDDVTKSGMMRLVGTDLYRRMTVRNCNTLRKLADLMRRFAE